jgi:tRNA U34 2-thiouridine synthase MnmA/TrmU
MFSRAKEMMSEVGARFVITGEVLGQRPMSQNKQALKLIRHRSGLEDLLLRPLCAQFFPPSLAEKEGWVKRDKLLNFNGRLRTPQMRLAKDLGFDDYANPAGGCLLTDPSFSKRLIELLNHDELNLENLELLKVGRHFRLSNNTRLVVGRDEGENNQIAKLAQAGDYLFSPQKDLAGPTSLARGPINQELIFLSSQITSAYTDAVGLEKIEVLYRQVPAIADSVHQIPYLPKERFTHLFI